MACRICGSPVEKDSKLCPHCGTKYVLKQKHTRENVSKWLKILMITLAALAVVVGGVLLFGKNLIGNWTGVYNESKEAHLTAQSLAENHDYVGAIKQLQLVEPGYSGYKNAQELLTKTIGNYIADVIAEAKEMEITGQYDKAIAVFKRALAVLPHEQQLASTLENTKVRCKQYYYDLVDECLGKGNGIEAISLLDTVSGLFPGDAEVGDKYTLVYKSIILDRVAEYEADNDLEGAIKYLEANINKVGADDTITRKLHSLVAYFKDGLLKEAERTLKDKGYEAAIAILIDGLDVVGDDRELQAKIEEFEQYKPMSVISLTVLKEGVFADRAWGYSLSTYKDVRGTQYERTLPIHIHNTSAGNYYNEKVFDLQEGYKYLSGVFFVRPDTSASTSACVEICVYGDNDFLWSYKLYRDTAAKAFKLNISGYETISIGFNSNVFAESFYCGLSDLVVGR